MNRVPTSSVSIWLRQDQDEATSCRHHLMGMSPGAREPLITAQAQAHKHWCGDLLLFSKFFIPSSTVVNSPPQDPYIKRSILPASRDISRVHLSRSSMPCLWYLSPIGANSLKILSTSAISSSVSSLSTAFSQTRSGDEAPGMGMIVGIPGRLERANTQLMAN